MKHAVKVLAILLVILTASLLLPAAADYSQALVIAAIITALLLLIASFATPSSTTPAARPAIADAVKPSPTAAPHHQAQAEVITLLGVFQEKGRLIDFLMEDIAPHSDADVGAVARAVHQGCKAALAEHFQIEPISPQGEGAAITVPAGYAAEEFRLIGNLSGGAPFAGTVVHKGWRTTQVKLPRVLNTGGEQLPAIAPAQIEVR
jgi:hypothetical protein